MTTPLDLTRRRATASLLLTALAESLRLNAAETPSIEGGSPGTVGPACGNLRERYDVPPFRRDESAVV